MEPELIKLEDPATLTAFALLPPPPHDVFKDRLDWLDAGDAGRSAEDAELQKVPFLRLAWLWLTAHEEPNTAVTTAFLNLRRRHLSRRSPGGGPGKGEGGPGGVWQELGPNLLRCCAAPFVEAVRQLEDVCQGRDYPRCAADFARALVDVPQLQGARRELEDALRKSLAASSEELILQHLGKYMADWLPSAGWDDPATIVRVLKQHRTKVRGAGLPEDVLERLEREGAHELLLSCALRHPQLHVVRLTKKGRPKEVPRNISLEELKNLLAEGRQNLRIYATPFDEQILRRLSDYMADWLPSAGLDEPAAIARVLKQHRTKVRGAGLPEDVLERLEREGADELLLSCALRHPQLHVVRLTKKDGPKEVPRNISFAKLKILLAAGQNLRIYPGTKGALLRPSAADKSDQPLGMAAVTW